MLKADFDFLALDREQRRANAQIPTDISEVSSEQDFNDNIESQSEIDEIEEIEDPNSSHEQIEDSNSSHEQIDHEIKIEKIQSSSPIVTETKQVQALQLLKSAFDLIKSALSLLGENDAITRILEPIAEVAVESSAAPVAVESSAAPVAEEPIVQNYVKPITPKAIKGVVPKISEIEDVNVPPKVAEILAASKAANVAPKVIPKVAEILAASKAANVAPKVIPKVAEILAASKAANVATEEFTVVMPKKSKNKTATMVVVEEPKDEFPSLVSSFSPVQKTGFWNSGKNSLEIAKSIASIPSPPPTKSPTLTIPVKVRAGSRGPIQEEDSNCDDEYNHRKNVRGDGDTYWQ